jgi:hypothetical protein
LRPDDFYQAAWQFAGPLFGGGPSGASARERGRQIVRSSQLVLVTETAQELGAAVATRFVCAWAKVSRRGGGAEVHDPAAQMIGIAGGRSFFHEFEIRRLHPAPAFMVSDCMVSDSPVTPDGLRFARTYPLETIHIVAAATPRVHVPPDEEHEPVATRLGEALPEHVTLNLHAAEALRGSAFDLKGSRNTVHS